MTSGLSSDALLCVHSSFAIILIGNWLLCFFSSWCLVIAVWLFLKVPRICLQFVIVVLPDHTHLLFVEQTFRETGHYLTETDLMYNWTDITKEHEGEHLTD